MKIILKSLSLIIYILSFLFPRNRSIWAFGSETGFDGNSKYFMIDVVEHHPSIRPIWITKRRKEIQSLKQKGLEAYYSFSIKGIIMSLRASKYIVSGSLADINFYTSGGAKYIQLWHGIGIKCCLWNNKNSVFNTKNKIVGFILRPSFYVRPDYILGASSMMNKHLASMFRVNQDVCRSTLYPRCEIFFREKRDIENFVKRWESPEIIEFIEKLKTYKKVFLYMPTFRDNNPEFLEQQKWDLERLDNELKRINGLLIVKLHPHMTSTLRFENYSSITEIKKNIDIYSILAFTHCLITDYSSVLYDYILMNGKEIIRYVPDLDEYISKSRDLLMDYKSNSVGVIASSFEELLSHIGDDLSIDYEWLRERFWGDALKNRLDKLFEEIYDI